MKCELGLDCYFVGDEEDDDSVGYYFKCKKCSCNEWCSHRYRSQYVAQIKVEVFDAPLLITIFEG